MYITAPATGVIEILSASVTDENNTTNQQLECTLQRVTTLGTPTGTAVTAAKHETLDGASAATVVGNVTASEPTYTANTDIGHEGFPSLSGWFFQPVPEERPIIPPSATMGLRCISTPTSQDSQVRITYREIG